MPSLRVIWSRKECITGSVRKFEDFLFYQIAYLFEHNKYLGNEIKMIDHQKEMQ